MLIDYQLTTAEVARLLNVHPSTIKRWCDNSALGYDRTRGGHRRIRLADALELASDKGIQTWLDAFRESANEVFDVVRHAEGNNFDPYVSLSLDGFLSERPHDLGVLTFLLLTHPTLDPLGVLDLGVRGLMQEVGRRWFTSRIGVAEERFVSECVAEALVAATRLGEAGPSTNGSAVVGSCEPGKHDLGSRCVRFCLSRQSWETFYLGASVPVQEMAAMQRQRTSPLVCVSFSRPARGSDVLRAVRTLADSYDPAAPYALAIGGDPVADLALETLPRPFLRFGSFESVTEFDSWLAQGLH